MIILDPVMAMQLWLTLKTFQKTSGFGRYISKINDTSFISAIKRSMARITWLNAIHSASVLLIGISVYNLIHHNTGHPVYVIIYPVRVMTFYAL